MNLPVGKVQIDKPLTQVSKSYMEKQDDYKPPQWFHKLDDSIDSLIASEVKRALIYFNGHIQQCCHALKIPRASFYRYMKKYNLNHKSFKVRNERL